MNRGQVSLEFLLLIGVFFSCLLLILPAINFSMQQIMNTNDVLLAKQISQIIENEDELFLFTGNGSTKEFEFIPTNKITLQTQGNNFEVFTDQKKFSVELSGIQDSHKTEFTTKFFISIKKENNITKINFYN
ncbi:MAG: hypothetical protein WC915_02915 [archaeon]|jgi:uncharacterized protein (UPF0333 family)